MLQCVFCNLVRSCASSLGPTVVRPAVHQDNVILLNSVNAIILKYGSKYKYTSIRGAGEGSCIWNLILPKEQRLTFVDYQVSIDLNHLKGKTLQTGKTGRTEHLELHLAIHRHDWNLLFFSPKS